MGWKRRRERWRKLPRTKEHGLGFGVHWGRYQKIPKVPGGPEMTVSSSGEVRESRPWSIWKWLGILPFGLLAYVLVFPLLFTWVFWAALAVLFAVLTYRTWRR
jgi:hypothetical protein